MMKISIKRVRIGTLLVWTAVVVFVICATAWLRGNRCSLEELRDLRQLRANKACTRFQQEIPAELTLPPSYVEMYVDDKRRYIYCLISKVSCTTWKRTLFKLSDNATVHKFLNGSEEIPFGLVHRHTFTNRILRRLSSYKPEEMRYRLNTYYKFMFVREPLERLVSAYRDKMFRDPFYLQTLVPKIITKYRSSIHHNDTNVTFAEFVRFVIDSWHEGEELDRHWSPQFRLCQPCQIRYDFMGHYETLYDDADAVLARLNTGVKPQNVAVSHFPRADPDNKRVGGSSEAMRKLYSSVSRNDIRELYSLYAPDYELFGYSHPYVL